MAIQHRASSNLAERRQILALATLVFAFLACAGCVIVGLLDHHTQPAVIPLIPEVRYALAILISAALSLLVHCRLRRDGESAWAYRALGEGAEEKKVATAVDQVARIVTSTLNIHDVYHRFGAELSKLVDCDRIAIFVVGEQPGTMEVKYIFGVTLPGQVLGEAVPLAGTRTQIVLETGKTHIWEDFGDLNKYRSEKALSKLGIRAGITAPLVSKGRLVGTLNLRSRRLRSERVTDRGTAGRSDRSGHRKL
jgi:hypothetical protein